MVILTGKGRKVRQVPLMKDTCKLLDRYIRSFHSDSQSQMIPLFYNAKKQALSRYGVTYILKKYAAKASPVLEPQNISPHVLRHTKAMLLFKKAIIGMVSRLIPLSMTLCKKLMYHYFRF